MNFGLAADLLRCGDRNRGSTVLTTGRHAAALSGQATDGRGRRGQLLFVFQDRAARPRRLWSPRRVRESAAGQGERSMR